MDEHKNFRRVGTAPFSGLFKRIEDFQLTDLLQRDFPEGIQTYQAVRGNFPWQLDHAFVSASVQRRFTSDVLSGDHLRQLSDHNPVIVELS
jgi:endonuclease/exonuclease/phosphatase family metal-dependent hydrolase